METHRSPKSSVSSVTTPPAHTKRIPFFRKVTGTRRPHARLLHPACPNTAWEGWRGPRGHPPGAGEGGGRTLPEHSCLRRRGVSSRRSTGASVCGGTGRRGWPPCTLGWVSPWLCSPHGPWDGSVCGCVPPMGWISPWLSPPMGHGMDRSVAVFPPMGNGLDQSVAVSPPMVCGMDQSMTDPPTVIHGMD